MRIYSPKFAKYDTRNVFECFQTNFYILFAITAAGVVSCGGSQMSLVDHPQSRLYFTFGSLRSVGIF